MLVLDQGIDSGGINRHVDQLLSGEIQRHPFTGSQRHRAQPGGDDPFVAHLGRQQGDVPLVGRRKRPLIEYAAGCVFAVEPVATGHEIVVIHVQGGRHKPARINF